MPSSEKAPTVNKVMDREKIIQKCICIASLAERRGKIILTIRKAALVEGYISKEIRELEELLK